MPKAINPQPQGTTEEQVSLSHSWKWCLRCERAFNANSIGPCCYKGCDGNAADIREWEDVRLNNPTFPETPILDHVYPLLPSKKAPEQR